MEQVAAVREGMSTMIPVPLLTLMTAKNLEQCVCGMEEIDIMMLKKVVRYILYMQGAVHSATCTTKPLHKEKGKALWLLNKHP